MAALVYPVPANSIVTQTYAQHVARARAHGWCPGPGNCPGGVYYFGGIDYGVRMSTPVAAAADGVVTVARSDASGYGLHVRIEHDGGYLTVYGHLSMLYVAVGQTVSAGQMIGLSGNTGNSTGPHLHFELRRNNTPIDPQPYLTQQPEPEPTPAADYQPGDQVRTVAQYNLRTSPELADNILGLSRVGAMLTVDDVSGEWIKATVYIHRNGVRR